jgi:hypothetical protein
MNKNQINDFYGPKSPYNHSQTLRKFLNMSVLDVQNNLHADIRKLAAAKAFEVLNII